MTADNLWPKGSATADPRRLLDEAKRILADTETELEAAKTVVDAPPPDVLLADMPDSVLSGRLGEICQRRMKLFPLAYSWLSIVTVASALAPRRVSATKFNLFTGLVGPVHSGKSQAIDWAQRLMGIDRPELLATLAGSAEGLIGSIKDALGAPRLLSPDELGHLFSKAAIQNASFPFVLCRAFYHDKFMMLMSRGRSTEFNASLSILGGLTEEKFQDSFSAATVAGLYDRFLLSCCPEGFLFDYEPFYGGGETLAPIAVAIDPDVWVEKGAWMREEPEIQSRVAELAIRVAAVCASFDRKDQLTAADLGPARELARYETRIRRLLRPNPGETYSGKIAYKVLDYLERHNGKLVEKRKMMREIHANRYGPDVAKRTFDTLCANGEIEESKMGKLRLVRRVPEERVSPIVLRPEEPDATDL